MIISKEEYEALVRQSERVLVLEKLLNMETIFLTKKEILAVLGWKENEEPSIKEVK